MMKKVNNQTQSDGEHALDCGEVRLSPQSCDEPPVITLFRKNSTQYNSRNVNSLCDLSAKRRGRRRVKSCDNIPAPPKCADKECNVTESDFDMHVGTFKVMRLTTPESTVTKIVFKHSSTKENHTQVYTYTTPTYTPPPFGSVVDGFANEAPQSCAYPYPYQPYINYCPNHNPMNYYMGSYQCNPWMGYY